MRTILRRTLGLCWPTIFLGLALLCGCSHSRRDSATSPRITSHQSSFETLFDGFEGGSIAGFWKPGNFGSGRYEPGAVQMADTFARAGRRSVCITVHRGDVEQKGDHDTFTERAELDSGRHPFLGRDVWYGFSFLVPPDFPIVENRLVIAQWKQEGVSAPLIALRYRGGKLYLTTSDFGSVEGAKRRHDLPEIQPGKWIDMVFHVRFSLKHDGIVELWMNGIPVVARNGLTASAAGENEIYNKLGLYRDRWSEPMTICFDNYTLGDRREAVDPARFDQPR